MKTIIFKDFDGHEWSVSQPRIDSAFPEIMKRLKEVVPVETVDAEKIKNMVASIEIDCQRDITPAEANKLVSTIKQYIIQEIDVAEKYYIGKKQRQETRGKHGNRKETRETKDTKDTKDT